MGGWVGLAGWLAGSLTIVGDGQSLRRSHTAHCRLGDTVIHLRPTSETKYRTMTFKQSHTQTNTDTDASIDAIKDADIDKDQDARRVPSPQYMAETLMSLQANCVCTSLKSVQPGGPMAVHDRLCGKAPTPKIKDDCSFSIPDDCAPAPCRCSGVNGIRKLPERSHYVFELCFLKLASQRC